MESGRGQEHADRGRFERALSTSVHGNSRAFGFSIMITAAFGALSTVEGTPELPRILLFGLGAALPIAALEAIVTRGFRAPAESTPSEVAMLGTALNLLSVAAGIATAIAVGEVVAGLAAWPLGAAAAAMAYMLAESAELMAAELIQRARGDPDAESGTEQ